MAGKVMEVDLEEFLKSRLRRKVSFDLSPFQSVALCLAFSFCFVLGLYLGKRSKTQNRDEVSVIKRRMISSSLITLLCFATLLVLCKPTNSDKGHTLLEWVGFKGTGILLATSLPIVVTIIGFLGPLCQNLLRVLWPAKAIRVSSSKVVWTKDDMWPVLRNIVISPALEETVFRGCMMPLLLSTFEPITAILLAPAFFSLCHLHHLIQHVVYEGASLATALCSVLFQMGYTYVFGVYSAFLFVRTGHLVSAVLVHAFCNGLGFPDVAGVLAVSALRRSVLIFVYVFGAVLWARLLFPLTEPVLFD